MRGNPGNLRTAAAAKSAAARARAEDGLRQMRRRRRNGEQQAPIEIARLGRPGIAAPAAPRRMPRRHRAPQHQSRTSQAA